MAARGGSRTSATKGEAVKYLWLVWSIALALGLVACMADALPIPPEPPATVSVPPPSSSPAASVSHPAVVAVTLSYKAAVASERSAVAAATTPEQVQAIRRAHANATTALQPVEWARGPVAPDALANARAAVAGLWDALGGAGAPKP
jgi:hypothetical protein